MTVLLLDFQIFEKGFVSYWHVFVSGGDSASQGCANSCSRDVRIQSGPYFVTQLLSCSLESGSEEPFPPFFRDFYIGIRLHYVYT